MCACLQYVISLISWRFHVNFLLLSVLKLIHINFVLISLSIDFPQANHLERQWAGLVQSPPHVTHWDTGLSVDLLKFVGAQSVNVPSDLVSFEINHYN